MRIGFNWAEIVDCHDFDIGAARFDDCTQDITSNPSESVYCDFDCQRSSPVLGGMHLAPEGDQSDQVHEFSS
jgi:hypothetical protein